MANKRTKKKRQAKSQNYLENINVDIDYDKLADAIVKAHKEIKDTEKKEIEQQVNEERKEWLRIIGHVELDQSQ